MRILGIDPGNKGAICLVEDGELKHLYDMPIQRIERNKKTKSTLDKYEFSRLIDVMAKEGIDKAYVEKVWSRPGQEGMFVFGYGCGLIEGVLAAHFIPIEMPTPQIWQRRMKVPKSVNAKGERTKDGALLRIKELWPQHCGLFARKMDEGRSDACLLALYGWEESK